MVRSSFTASSLCNTASHVFALSVREGKISMSIASFAKGITRRDLLSRTTVLGSSGALGLISGGAWAQATKPVAISADELRVMIGRATRLSVLSDRVTRCQVQRSLKVLVSRAERQFDDTGREVREVLGLLASSSLPDEARKPVGPAREAYEVFLRKALAMDLSKQDGLVAFADEADKVGDAVDTVVKALVVVKGTNTSQVLATTAELQRLTQHAAVHFLLGSAGIDTSEQLKEVTQARAAFSQGLNALRNNSVKSNGTESQLQLLEPQWLLMSNALANPGKEAKRMEDICTTSERLLEVTTSLYKLYDGLLKA
jgi:hypothetical protein